jgi:hypothetical protein
MVRSPSPQSKTEGTNHSAKRSRSPDRVQRKGRGFTSGTGLRAWDTRKYPEPKLEGKTALSMTKAWNRDTVRDPGKDGSEVHSTVQPKVSVRRWKHDKFTLSRSKSPEVRTRQDGHRPSPTYD